MKNAINKTKERWHTEAGYHEVLRVAFPLVLSTGAWAVQHFFDRMFLTWYSADALAAAMPAGILNFTIMALFLGTSGYVNTFVAQYFGAGQNNRIGPVLWQGVYIALFAAVVHLALIPLAKPFFQFVGHDPKVMRLEIIYFQILCLGAGPVVGGAALASFYSGRGKTLPVMWVNFAATVLNIILNYILIFGRLGLPPMGITGAGIATVISGFFSLFVYVAIICRRSHEEAYQTMSGWKFNRPLFLRLLRFGLPNGIPFFLEHVCFTAFCLMIGRLGIIQLAATNLTLNIETLGFMPMLGFGMAVSILVGQRLGEDRPDLAERSVYSGFHLTFVYMAGAALAYVLIPEVLFWPFVVNADPVSIAPIRELAIVLLKFVAVFCLFDTMAVIFSFGVRGAGDTKFAMFLVVISSILGLALPSYIALGLLGMGSYAAWTILTVYIGILGLAFLIRFSGGKWKSMRVIETAEPTVLESTAISERDVLLEPVKGA